MYDPDMARKARDDDEDYYRERAALIDVRIAEDEREHPKEHQ
jgi:hypothetical protein